MFSDKTILRALLKLALPTMGVQLLQTGYQLTDAYWVGRLGANAVAAVAVNFPVNFLFLSLGSGFAVAGSILVAQNVGAGKRQMVDHVTTQTFTMIVLVSLLLTVVSCCLSAPILSLLGVSATIFPDALLFLRITLLGIPLTFIFILFQSVMRGVGKVSVPLVINVITVVLNFLLDPLFIYGWGPIAAHGVAGAAIATLITQLLSAIAGVYLLLDGKQGIKLKWRELAPDWPLIRKAFKLGLPSSVELSVRSLGLNVMVLLVTGYGTAILAVYGIGVRLLTLIVIPAMGMSMASSTLVGQSIGANLPERAEKISRLALMITFIFLSGIGILCYIFAPIVVGFFVKGNEYVMQEAVAYIHVGALFFGFLGLQQVLGGIFKGAGDTVKSMLLSIINGWVIQFPAALVLSRLFHFGYLGVWMASPLSNVFTAMIALYWYQKGRWKSKRLVL
ncbi:MATE family efflux transporter [Chitinophaga sp. 30R24]|uniref:MATE family efflux transporter n=1 Tax=Chitinophaga sp. 30R24 TaxID=3248838 RepID=UPI003B91101A